MQLLRAFIFGDFAPRDPQKCAQFGVNTVEDLGKQFRRELEEFFVNNHRVEGRDYRVLAMKGPDRARKLIKNARQ